ncbi:MAG: hypothetical protein R3B82_03480 [Sandaracinaceae bacterium]
MQYERYLSTPSAFDRGSAADDALTEQQQRGLRTFVEVSCTAMPPRGRNVGGMYQRMGLVDYFERRGAPDGADNGRFNVHARGHRPAHVQGADARNIDTAPYFHDGQENELSGAVRTMGYVQLDRELTDAQVDDIVAFLHSLTGELPADARIPGAEGETEGEAPAAAGGEAPAGETAAE